MKIFLVFLRRSAEIKPVPASQKICWFLVEISKQLVFPPYFKKFLFAFGAEPRVPWIKNFISVKSFQLIKTRRLRFLGESNARVRFDASARSPFREQIYWG